MSQLRFIGSYCSKDIRSRIEMGKIIFIKKKKWFTVKMNLELKKRIMKCLVWTLECSIVCSRGVDIDADRQKIRTI